MTVYRFDDGPGSRVHALVVGVGVYPYCGRTVPWGHRRSLCSAP